MIKLEEPKGGDIARAQNNDELFFLAFNSNKRSLTLNLKSDEAKALFRKIIAQSDVLIENFGPGALDRLGLGWNDLQKINPRLIFATIKGFGTYGPHAHMKSFEPIAQAMGGAMCVTGSADGPPTYNWPAIGNSGTGMHMAIAILAAINQRHATGRGQHVEVSMQESVLNLIRVSLREHRAHRRADANRQSTGQDGARHGVRLRARRSQRLGLHLCSAADVARGVQSAGTAGTRARSSVRKTAGDRWTNRATLDGIVTESDLHPH